MRQRFPTLAGLVGFAFVALAGRAAPTEASREVENLATFARVYGYVRFFHPSDAATQVDWDKVALMGVEAVREARDGGELRAALRRVFQPLAPTLGLAANLATLPVPAAAKRAGPVTFWQYRGIKLSEQPGPYEQRRVVVGAELAGRAPLFTPAEVPEPIALQLTPEVALVLPAALPVGEAGATRGERPAELAALQARLAGIDLPAATPTDWRVRVGGVVTVWTIFQHFHPYLDVVGDRWEDTLRPALRRALDDATADDYQRTLSEMIARSEDGHGYVYGAGGTVGGLPVRVTLAEDQIVVTEAAAGVDLRPGDLVRRIDGVAARDALRDWERYTPGSPQLRQFRALNQFGAGPADRIARLDVVRAGEARAVELPRDSKRRGYFFKSLQAPATPGFAEVRPGIYYLNLHALTAQELAMKLPQLAEARGLIFDWRALGHRTQPAAGHPIEPHADILPHLIDQPIQASPMLVPEISRPDRAGWSHDEQTWPVEPQPPRFKGRAVFINDPSVVSYGETCIAMVAHYRLATLVGTATAGCNGNANFIPLPGGFRVMWTGMEVRKHDHTPFYGVGFGPEVPVVRTIEGIREGRDEWLAAAIRFLDEPGEPR